VNGFLDAAIAALPGWRKILPNYPVVSWLSFVEYIRATVNSLASDGHIRELVCQLQLVGEVIDAAQIANLIRRACLIVIALATSWSV